MFDFKGQKISNIYNDIRIMLLYIDETIQNGVHII